MKAVAAVFAVLAKAADLRVSALATILTLVTITILALATITTLIITTLVLGFVGGCGRFCLAAFVISSSTSLACSTTLGKSHYMALPWLTWWWCADFGLAMFC